MTNFEIIERVRRILKDADRDTLLKIIEFMCIGRYNIIRKENYSVLCDEYDKPEISDEDFGKLIDKEPDKYVISNDMIPEDDVFKLIIELTSMLEFKYVDDVSDAFGISKQWMHSLIQQFE